MTVTNPYNQSLTSQSLAALNKQAAASSDLLAYLSGEPELTQAATEELVQLTTELQQAYELGRIDMDFLDALARPDAHEYDFPPTFLAIWEWLRSYAHRIRDFSKLAIGLPRGFGKSSVIKLFILYCILYTDKQFVLVLAANQKLAENILADVIDMLDSENIRSIYGDWRIGLEKDTQSLYKTSFRGRPIILAALGQGGSVRGLNLKNARPDVMIFDDVQTREDADSKITSEAIETWMVGTAMKAKSPKGCLFIFIANMYPTPYSILRKLKRNHTWTKFIAGGILADGSSLWEELQPVSQLLEEYESDLAAGRPEIFHAEVLNDEHASVNTKLDISQVPTVELDPQETGQGKFIVIDPSNDKVNSDAVSIGLFMVVDGKPVLVDLIEGRLSPSDTVREALKLALNTGTYLIVVEANAFQYSLIHWFEVIMQQLQITGISAEPIYSGALAKNTRILNMFKELLAGSVLINNKNRAGEPLRSHVLMQAAQFNPLKNDNVDGILDLLTYAPRVLTELQHKIVLEASYTEQYAELPSLEEMASF